LPRYIAISGHGRPAGHPGLFFLPAADLSPDWICGHEPERASTWLTSRLPCPWDRSSSWRQGSWWMRSKRAP